MSAVTPYNKDNISLFQPNQVSGLALWLDAADSSSVITSGANVTAWNDKSGNLRNFTLTGATNPTYSTNVKNGLSAVTFNGTNQNMNNNTLVFPNSAYTVFTVQYLASTTGNTSGYQRLIQGGVDYALVVGTLNGNVAVFTGNANGGWNDSAQLANPIVNNIGVWCLVSFTVSSTVMTTFVNGSANTIKTGTTQAFTGLTIGGSTNPIYQFWNGYGAEIIIYNSALSTTQRQQIESYLAYKWNLQSSLPSSHPYYASPYNAIASLTNINQITKFAYPMLPSDIGGLALWLDAADSASVSVSPGTQNVTFWKDKSGGGYNATPFGTGSPTYSSNSITFTGAQAFSTTLSSALPNQSGFAVVKYSSANKIDILSVRELTGTAGGIQQIIQNNAQLITTYGGTTIVTGATLTQNTTLLYNHTFSATTNAFLYLNGSQTGQTTGPYTFTGTGTVNIGAYDLVPSTNEGFIGSMYEILLFNVVLTTTQRQQIEGYLAWKWNLQTSLPSTHPYYNNAFIPNMSISIPTTVTIYQYSPKSLSGLALWLDAADTATVSVSPGTQNITGWNDKSGGGNNFTTVAGSPTYTSASQGIFFNGTNVDCMQSSSAISYTNGVTSLFVVTKITATNGGGWAYIVTFGNGIDYSLRYRPSGAPDVNDAITYGNLWYLNGNSQSAGTSLPASVINATSLINGVVNKTQSSVIQVSTTYNPRYLTGFVQEVIMYNTSLTTIQRQQVEGYLAWKWSLVSSLPSNHPYKLYPP